MKLKICNVKTIQETRMIADLGVDYIGFHLVSDHDYKRKNEIKKCISELRKYYSKSSSVLITKEKTCSKLLKLVTELEPDYIQLHYPNSLYQIKFVKLNLDKAVKVIQVTTLKDRSNVSKYSDIILIDKSFLGGTGNNIETESLQKIINRIKDKEILLAGGININNIKLYKRFNVSGFDIQSKVRNEENEISYLKTREIMQEINREYTLPSGKVGFAIQNIYQENMELLNKILDLNIDFLHIDVSDGFVSNETDLSTTLELIKKINQMSSNILVQYHLFVYSECGLNKIIKALTMYKHFYSKYFLHVNRNNIKNLERILQNWEHSFSLDVKDVVSDGFNWEPFLRNEIILCLQSKSHTNRIFELGKALKILEFSGNPVVNIDRQIDYQVLLELENRNKLNVISGTYLSQNIKNNYILVKELLNNV